VNLLEIALVAGDRKHMINGDTRLKRFDVEFDGFELTGTLIRRANDDLRVKFPRGARRIDPAQKRHLAKLAFAAFRAAGGIEWYPTHSAP
jgi:hypothetical protein